MNEETKNLIKKEFLGVAKARHNALKNLDIKDFNFNPFLLRILNLDTPHKIAEFMLNERLERSVVTSFGTRIQNISKLLGCEGTGAEGGDVLLKKDEKRYYIQMKAGPNTPNKELTKAINQLLISATRRNAGSIPLLGMTYGTRQKVSGIIKRYSQIDWKIGREFWDFIGTKGIAKELYQIIAEVNKEIDDTKLYEEKLLALENAIRDKYGKGEDIWSNLFEDNM